MPVLRAAFATLLTLAACAEGERIDAALEQPARQPDAGLRVPRVVEHDEACAMQSTRALPGIAKQVDIIFVIDNSGSMTDEIDAVRHNINDNFAAIIEDSGVDYRVILLSRFGSEGTAICIDPPLAGAECAAGIFSSPGESFLHYDIEIASTDAFCRILESFDQPDPARLAPDGWGGFLRPDAQKAFVLITDDSASCTFGFGEEAVTFGAPNDPFEDALLFHEALLGRSPEQFGEPPEVKYAFYSIVGLHEGDNIGEPFFPHQDLVDTGCATAASPGLSYQALSVITDALRYPVCEGRGFDAVFRVLARSVIETAKADCIFEIPEAPRGQTIDRTTINVEYTPGDGSPARRFDRAGEREACDDEGFFVAEDRIELCPDACRVVEADDDAELTVHYACTVRPD